MTASLARRSPATPAQPPMMLPMPQPPLWMDFAACAGPGIDPALFDATPPTRRGPRAAELALPALAVCNRCPVVPECDELANTVHPRDRGYSVWGGRLYNKEGK